MNKLLLALAFVGALFAAPAAHAEGTATNAYVASSSVANSAAGTNALVFNNEVAGYGVATIQFTSIGSGNTVTLEESNDNVSWFTTPGSNLDGSAHTGVISPSLTVAPVVALGMRYWRARLSTYSSGSVAGIVTYKALSGSAADVSGGSSVVGGPAVDDAAASGNPVPVGGKYNATLPTYTDGDRTQLQMGTRGSLNVTILGSGGTSSPAIGTPGDAQAPTTGMFVNTQTYNYTGATQNLARSVINATDSTGTGIAAAGLVAQFDDVSPTAKTENQFGNLRETATGGLIGGHVLTNGALTEDNFACNSFAAISVTAGNTTQIIALSGTTVVRVCTISVSTSLTGSWTILSGTGSNCGTPANSTGAMPIVTGSQVTVGGTGDSAVYRGSAGGELCVAAVTGNVTGWVMYAQY